MKKRSRRKQLHDKAWKKFSIYIRKKYADWRGYVSCVTCGATYLWNSGFIHCGHWIHDKLDFEETNLHPQCANCNYKYNKNVNTSYAVFMAKTYGVKHMEKLREMAFNKESPKYRGNDYSIEELEQIIEKYV